MLDLLRPDTSVFQCCLGRREFCPGMAKLNENLRAILVHLKAKGLSIKDVADQAFFFDADERDAYYKWLRRVKTEENSRSNARYERALLCLLRTSRGSPLLSDDGFNVEKCLSRYDFIGEVNEGGFGAAEVRRMMKVFADHPFGTTRASMVLDFIEREAPRMPIGELLQKFSGKPVVPAERKLSNDLLSRLKDRISASSVEGGDVRDRKLFELLSGREADPVQGITALPKLFDPTKRSYLEKVVKNVQARIGTDPTPDQAIDALLDQFLETGGMEFLDGLPGARG
jgi:hypothetical protein